MITMQRLIWLIVSVLSILSVLLSHHYTPLLQVTGKAYLSYLDDVLDHCRSSLEVKLYAQDLQGDGVGHPVEACDHLHDVWSCRA